MPWRRNTLWPSTEADVKMVDVAPPTLMDQARLETNFFPILSGASNASAARLQAFSINLDKGKTVGVVSLAGPDVDKSRDEE